MADIIAEPPPLGQCFNRRCFDNNLTKFDVKLSLVKFYRKYNPKNVSIVDELLKNDFEELYNAILNKYNHVPYGWKNHLINLKKKVDKNERSYKNKKKTSYNYFNIFLYPLKLGLYLIVEILILFIILWLICVILLFIKYTYNIFNKICWFIEIFH